MVTPAEISRHWGISEQALSQRIARGTFPEPVKVAGRVRLYLHDEIDWYMDRVRREARRTELQRWIGAAQRVVDDADGDEDISSARHTLTAYKAELEQLGD